MVARALIFIAVLVVVCLAPAATPGDSRAGGDVRELEIVVARPDGARILLLFTVDAATEGAAAEAALFAARQLIPGGVVLEDSGVNAQFAPWWWQWDPAELPVPVAYNPSGAVDGVGPDVVSKALLPWSSEPTSSFAFEYAGTTNLGASVHQGVNDGVNVVAWQQLECEAGCVLGVTTKMESHETDVVLNSNPRAKLRDGSNGTVDARSVLLHEAGHMAGLEHSCPLFDCSPAEQDAIMYFQYRGMKRDLRPDDVAGLAALYPLAQSAPQLVSLELAVQPGWALTSLPPGALASSMDSLTCVDAVYAFREGRWDVWIRDLHPSFQRLSWIEAGAAYWIHSTGACSHVFQLVPEG